MVLAIPTASPKMLINENPLFRKRFRHAILKKFLIIVKALAPG
jgi:hypothetical protein